MSVIASTVYELKQVEAITDIVEDRIYPVINKESALPCLIVKTDGHNQAMTLLGNLGTIRNVNISIDIYSKVYSEIDLLRMEITQHFQGFLGAWNADADNSVNVHSCNIDDTDELIDQADQEIYRCIVKIEALVS